MAKKLTDYILLGLIAAGAIIRLVGITATSYWEDELFTIDFSDPIRPFMEMYEKSVEISHPPLYQIQQWLWFKAVGYTEFSGRLLAILCSFGGLVAVYYLVKHFFGRRAGLYAAALASLNYLYVQYSLDTRSYAQFFLLAATTALFFAKALENPNLKSAALYSFSALALIYTHYVGLFFLMAQFLYFLVYIWKRGGSKSLLQAALASAAIISILYAPMYPHVFRHAARTDGISPEPYLGFFPESYLGFFNDSLLAGIYLLLILAAVASQWFRAQDRQAVLFLLVIAVLPCALTFARGMISEPIIKIHHTIIMLPGLFALAVYSLERASQKSWIGLCLAVAMVIFAGYSLAFRSNHFEYQSREDFRPAVQAVISGDVPAFAPRRTSKRLNAYLALLKSEFRVQPLTKLDEMKKNNAVPSRLWVLNVHYEFEWPKEEWPVVREISGNVMNGRLYEAR